MPGEADVEAGDVELSVELEGEDAVVPGEAARMARSFMRWKTPIPPSGADVGTEVS